MNRELRNPARYATDIVGGLVILAVIAGTGFSRYYWGYWLSPPAVGPTVRDLASLNGFASLDPERSAPDLGWKISMLSLADIRQGAEWYRESPIDAFWFRLHAAVDDEDLQVTSPLVTPELLLARIEKEVGASTLLLDGEPGYPFAKRLNGFAAFGPSRSGETLVVLALKGSEVSNDHYPVFDFVYACGVTEERCRLVRQNLYFEDVAGIEGFRWYSASLAALLIGGAAVSLWYLVVD